MNRYLLANKIAHTWLDLNKYLLKCIKEYSVCILISLFLHNY